MQNTSTLQAGERTQLKAEYESLTGYLIAESLNGPDFIQKEQVWVSGKEAWMTWIDIRAEIEAILEKRD